MGKNLIKRCPECDEILNMAHRRGGGAKCRTDGCPVQKVHHDKAGNVIKITYSTEPMLAPTQDQTEVMFL